MEVDLMICDFAQVSGGKLYISGAAISNVTIVDPTAPVTTFLAGIIRIPWNALNQQHTLAVVLQDADGQNVRFTNAPPEAPPEFGEEFAGGITGQFTAGRPPNMLPGDEAVMPVAMPLPAILPHLGPFVFRTFIDRLPVHSVRITAVQHMQPGIGA